MPKLKFTTINPEQMRNWARQLDRHSSAFEEIATEMEEDGFESLEVHNSCIGKRGMEFVTKFAAAAHQCKLAAMMQDNRYGTESIENE
jgi:hypothetical protein|tara:strand:- start:1800 stop:2063 length:264 start_codon:yes stop_codon:yes gene_type:complete